MQRFGSNVVATDIATIGLALGIPLTAAVGYLGFFPQAAMANPCGEGECMYDFVCYSEGACVKSCGTQYQVCDSGSWGPCGPCGPGC